MSALPDRARRLRDRPIAEQERHAAMILTVVLLAAVALLLALTQPARQASPTRTQPVVLAPAERGRHDPRLSSEAERTARRFLAGYLDYAYGHGRAETIRGVDPSFKRALLNARPPVSPAQAARHARVLSLQPATTTPNGQIDIAALVNASGPIDYQLEIALVRTHGRLLVTGLDGTQ